MRVTERDDLIGLKVLAMVLNFDFEAGSPQDLKTFKRLSPYDFSNVESVLTKSGPDEKKRANGTRAELRADLETIIAPGGKVRVTEAFLRIHKLLEKINKIEIKTIWGVESVNYKWAGSDEDAEFIPKEAEDARDTTWYWTSRRTVELLGYKWFIGVEGVEAEFAFSRVELYLKIRDAFQIGVFDRLRICPLCKKFLVAEDARQQFCSNEHRNEFNNKQRLESGWFRKNRRDNRQLQIVKARRLRREGKPPPQIAKETGLSLRILKREGIVR